MLLARCFTCLTQLSLQRGAEVLLVMQVTCNGLQGLILLLQVQLCLLLSSPQLTLQPVPSQYNVRTYARIASGAKVPLYKNILRPSSSASHPSLLSAWYICMHVHAHVRMYVLCMCH